MASENVHAPSLSEIDKIVIFDTEFFCHQSTLSKP